MEIELKYIPIREVVKDYADDAENGCRGYGGRLNIRPSFQREFIYSGSQRNAVIETVKKNFPLNVMYWVKSADGNFEMLDGQQRTISICQYERGEFTLADNVSFENLPKPVRDRFLEYRLMIYICDGDDEEKLDWFQTINIAGEKLTAQEMRNAIFACEWLNDAKKYFSKTNCPAHMRFGKYFKGSSIRQEYLETALKWIAARNKLDNLKKYMDLQKKNKVTSCAEMWNYIGEIFDWVEKIFPNYTSDMKGLDWGRLFEKYHEKNLDVKKIAAEVDKLYEDICVKNKSGIYEYVLEFVGNGNSESKFLNVRFFGDGVKKTVYAKQTKFAKAKKISNCPMCVLENKSNAEKIWKMSEMDADHVTAWSKGGTTDEKNCQMLCKFHNRMKGNS